MYLLAVVVASLAVALPGLDERAGSHSQQRAHSPRAGIDLPPLGSLPSGGTATVVAASPDIGLGTPPGMVNPGIPAISGGSQSGAAGTVFSWPPTPTTTTAGPSAPLASVPVPANGAYLGAFVDPFTSGGSATAAQELADLSGFNSEIHRKIAIVSVYQPWNAPLVQNETLSAIASSEGAIPMVSWRCGDSDTNINKGGDDASIFAYADQLKSYGRPVLLRWYWEVNLLQSDACLGPGSVAGRAGAYQAAFRRIYTIFQMAGATNVAFVWCPSTSASAAPMSLFYPGDAYVDWIGADGYDRRKLGANGFSTQFANWYGMYEGTGKPMMVDETGAPADDQVPYLQGIAQSVPADFPAIKALVYFDGQGHEDWRLDPNGGAHAFAALGATSFFQPMPPAG